MILGAITQSLPDIDFLAALWLKPTSNLLAHRGFTHSILFGIVASYLFALICRWRKREPEIGVNYWFFFFALQVFIHLLIDAMNVYGIGLFEPFDHRRLSLNILFVADPLFSIWPVFALFGLLFASSKHWRNRWTMIGIGGPALYLITAFVIKASIQSQLRDDLSSRGVVNTGNIVTPTPLNTLLWYVVAEEKDGFLIGYRSIFDDDLTRFKYFPKSEHFLDSVHQYDDVQRLRRFSQGYYIVQIENEHTVFIDLRFGQVFGWLDPEAQFVFRYYLEQPDTNMLVLQRGRFAAINKSNVTGTLRRIAGD